MKQIKKKFSERRESGLNFFWVFKDCFNKHGCNFDDSAKLATLVLLKIKVFWNKGYDIIISVHYLTKKIFWSCDQSLVSLGFKRSYHNLNFIKIWPEENNFFERCSWFKLINLGLALGMALKFYTSVAKGLKLEVWKFCGLLPTFVKVTGEKLVVGPFCSLILKTVKGNLYFLTISKTFISTPLTLKVYTLVAYY